MHRSRLSSALFAVAIILLTPWTSGAQAVTAPVVILVRHAEKAAMPADDPSLTPMGAERAKALDLALASANVTAIITTEFKRTRETAAVIAQRRGITVDVVGARGVAPAAHIQSVVSAIRKHTSGAVLVVGHSNTIPAIIAALGGERLRDLCDADYDNLFLMTGQGTDARLVKSKFGAADPIELGTANCTPMGG